MNITDDNYFIPIRDHYKGIFKGAGEKTKDILEDWLKNSGKRHREHMKENKEKYKQKAWVMALLSD